MCVEAGHEFACRVGSFWRSGSGRSGCIAYNGFQYRAVAGVFQFCHLGLGLGGHTKRKKGAPGHCWRWHSGQRIVNPRVYTGVRAPAAPGNGTMRAGKPDWRKAAPGAGSFFRLWPPGYSTNTPFGSSLTGSNEESSGKDSFSTCTGMPSLSSCKRTARPF